MCVCIQCLRWASWEQVVATDFPSAATERVAALEAELFGGSVLEAELLRAVSDSLAATRIDYSAYTHGIVCMMCYRQPS